MLQLLDLVTSSDGQAGASPAVTVTIGIVTAHFLNKKGWWFKVHALVMSFGVACLVSGVVLALMFTTNHLSNVHSITGLILVVLGVIQPFLGFAADLFYDPRRTEVPAVPDKAHRMLGRFVFVASFYVNLTGLQLTGDSPLGQGLLLLWLSVMVIAYIVKAVQDSAKQRQMAEARNDRTRRRTERRANFQEDEPRGVGSAPGVRLRINYYGTVRTFTLTRDTNPNDLLDDIYRQFRGLDATVVGVYRTGDAVLPIQLLPNFLGRIREDQDYLLALTTEDPNFGGDEDKHRSNVDSRISLMNRMSSIFGSKKQKEAPKPSTYYQQRDHAPRDPRDRAESHQRSRAESRKDSRSRKRTGSRGKVSTRDRGERDRERGTDRRRTEDVIPDEEAGFTPKSKDIYSFSENRNSSKPIRLSVYDMNGVRQKSLYLSQL